MDTLKQSNRKRELLDFLLQEEGRTSVDNNSSIARRKNLNEFPLSFAQRRLWFLNQLEPGPQYNDLFNLRLDGPLNIEVLQKGLNEIVRRHEALRANFTVQADEAVQNIVAPFDIPLPLVNLSTLAESDRQARAMETAAEFGRMTFDLRHGPLLRAKLVRLSNESHLLCFVFHHIAMDGWSRGVLIGELTTLYSAFLTEQNSPLPELPIQYADFAAWQQQQAQEDALAYWKQKLTGAPALLEWPTSFPRPAVQGFSGARQSLSIPKPLMEALKSLSQREGCTLFMTLLAALQTLAMRLSGQEDIVIGSPIANRNHAEIERLIGCFLNTLVLRTDLSDNPTFREVMARARETALAAYAHQDLPFEKLVEELHPPRDQSYHPVFQIMFAFQNTPAPVSTAGDLRITAFEIDSGTAKFDLLFNLAETPEGLSGWIEYATDLFDREAIDRLQGHYLKLLEEAVLNPDRRISTFPILPETEKRELLEKWNDTKADFRETSCLHELFEEQATHTPNAVAVVCGSDQLTYAELNDRADRFAHQLRKLGVGPETLVGLCLERSVEMVLALLAILKAGGAYVPLDPNYPQDRLAFILEDARAPVLLTHSSLLPSLPPHQAKVVCVDKLSSASTEEYSVSGVRADNVAYVLFTSGSTGRPKGVQITHQALVNFLVSMSRQPGLSATDTLLAVTTLSFDIAGLELWLPLIMGARVVIARAEETMDGKRLVKLLSQSQATLMQATPVTWRLLLEAGWQGDPNLKILCGGEAWSQELAAQLLPRCSSLWNMYGPTETTIWSAISQVRNGEAPMIGQPIANTQLYVLDNESQPVPVGVAGELHVGGDGLARGYLNRPELTAEKFISNPFKAGTRLYKTGDLVRRRKDGMIEFLSRKDHQVKLNGLRIELGEIESVLRQHAVVREAIVLVREDEPGNKRLVAYFVPNAEAKPVVEELREQLKAKLPEYMVPSAFVQLETLPLTNNGKVDRKTLPVPERQRFDSSANYTPPQTTVEKILADIWSRILQVEKVGVDDNFFDLGGHSLLLVKAHARICDALKTDFSIIKLFQHPTIRALARQFTRPEVASGPSGKILERARRQRAALGTTPCH